MAHVDLNGDNIIGDNYEVYIVGDQQSKFILNNKIKNSTTHLSFFVRLKTPL